MSEETTPDISEQPQAELNPEEQQQLGETALSDDQKALVVLNDDPSHPRGNQELAEQMAYAGKENRDLASEGRQAAAADRADGTDEASGIFKVGEFVDKESEQYDAKADEQEEQARADYLKTHPEIKKDDQSAEEKHIQIKHEDEPSEEDKARLQTLDSDSKHPRGNEVLAQEMASEVEPLIQIVENVRKSNLPDKEERAKDLEERGEELMQKARERFLKEEELYTGVRDHILGSLLGALARTSGGYSWIFIESQDEKGGNVHIDAGSHETATTLSPENASRLRKEYITLLGGNPDSDPNATITPRSGDDIRTAAIVETTDLGSNVPGVKATERVKFKNEQGQILRIREFGIDHSSQE